MTRHDRIDGAGLAGVGASGESDLTALIGRKLFDAGHREQKAHLRELAHRVKRRGSPGTERSVQFAAFQGARKTMIESRFSMKFAAAVLSMGLCFAGVVSAEEAGAAAAPAGTLVGS